MTFQQLIEKKDIEGIGKYYLAAGVEAYLSKDINKSYECFRIGLNILTCDCSRGNWLKKIEPSLYNISSFTNIQIKEFYFCKAFLLSYNSDLKSLYVALDDIENYLILAEDDSVGWYIKGKISIGLEKYQDALNCFQKSITLQPSSRTLYRIGRLKEQHLQEDGIADLFDAYIQNQSSACCCRVLQQYCFLRGHKIEVSDLDNGNLLVRGFNTYSDPWSLQKNIEDLIKNRQTGNLYQDTAENMILSDFVRQLILSKPNIIGSNLTEGDYEGDYDDYEEDDDYYEYEEDYDEMYFDAMTDGQLGSYDEFRERGGDLDYIDDWAGR